MANLCRVRVEWTGSSVIGGGVSTHYVDGAATGFLSDFRAYYFAWRFAVPSTVQWSFPNSGDLIDVATGGLVGTWTEPVEAPVVAAGAGGHVSGVGMRQTWLTSGIRGGRRVKGSTFFCPLTISMYDTDGTIVPGQITAANAAGAALVSALGTDLKIYSKPSPGNPGQSNTVIGSSSPDAISWLRSRRT